MSSPSTLLFPDVRVAPPSPAPPDDDVSSSSESSSIGSASTDGDDDRSSEETKDDATSSLGSLEDSLPVKKGLSSHFVGKSRSFSNLSECEVGNAGDLAKGENPFNKRRRIQIASRTSYQRRASCTSLIMVPLPPLLSPEHALQEEAEEEENDDGSGNGGRRSGQGFASLSPTSHGGKFFFDEKIKNVDKGGAKMTSPRSFPLLDLQHV